MPPSCECAYWLPGSGQWSDPTRWQSGQVPGANMDAMDIIIEGVEPSMQWLPGSNLGANAGSPSDPGTTSDVAIDLDVSIRDLLLGSGDRVRLLDGRRLVFKDDARPGRRMTSVAVHNSGVFEVDGQSMQTTLVVGEQAELRIEGGGELRLLNWPMARLVGETGAERLTIHDGLVRGAGMIGDGTLAIANGGVIEADAAFERLTIRPSLDGMVNTGTIRAVDFGRVELLNASVNNAGGVIEARRAGTIDLIDSVLEGGSIVTDPDAVVRSLFGSATLANVTIDGNVEVGQRELELRGTITNNGTIYAIGGHERGGSEGSYASRVLASPVLGDVRLEGHGTLILEDASIATAGLGVNALVINAAGHTIAGGGGLCDDTARFRNEGTIRADVELPLIINPRDGSSFENAGVIHVVTTLYLIDGTFNNEGEFIVEEGGQLVMLPGASLSNSFAGGLIGGRWTVRGRQAPGDLYLATVPDLDYNMGYVTLDGPLSLFDRFETIDTNLGMIRLVNGRVFTTEDNFTNAGMIDVGGGCVFETDGKLTLNPASRIRLEIGASTPASGRLDVHGRLSLKGELELVPGDGVTWTPGMTLDLIEANTITGAFDSIVAPGRVDVVVSGGDISFIALPPCPGDVDGDDVVGINDLLIVLDQWGACPAEASCSGDLDGSGDVNVLDLLDLLDGWGDCPTN